MTNLVKALGLQREVLAEKLAGPLSELLQHSGAAATPAAIREALLDKNTEINFPSFTIHRFADEVIVEVVEVTEVVTVSARGPGTRLNRIIQAPASR